MSYNLAMNTCKVCGAILNKNLTCHDYLDLIAQWDFEDFLGAGRLHLLTVISYNLQHPAIYSREGLEFAKNTLKTILKSIDSSTKEQERALSKDLSSASREWKIMASQDSQAGYSKDIAWSMTAADVVANGPDGYTSRVKDWGLSVYNDLKSAGQID
jgi:uncharacterized protein DUF5946